MFKEEKINLITMTAPVISSYSVPGLRSTPLYPITMVLLSPDGMSPFYGRRHHCSGRTAVAQHVAEPQPRLRNAPPHRVLTPRSRVCSRCPWPPVEPHGDRAERPLSSGSSGGLRRLSLSLYNSDIQSVRNPEAESLMSAVGQTVNSEWIVDD